VQCNITERGAINHMGGCMVAGGACIGCTMPGFPDKFAPFYVAPPGSAVSGGVSRAYASMIRRLRRITMQNDNREFIWDKTGHVPTGWAAEASAPTLAAKTMHFFYKKAKYWGTVDLHKRNMRQPLPKSRDVYAGVEPLTRYMPPEPQAEEGAHPEE
jgi:hydrogenase small subunit